jgi:hypothetical protein
VLDEKFVNVTTMVIMPEPNGKLLTPPRRVSDAHLTEFIRSAKLPKTVKTVKMRKTILRGKHITYGFSIGY